MRLFLLTLGPALVAAAFAAPVHGQERGTTLERFVATRSAHFLGADADRDGKLSADEWRQARSGAGGDASRLFAVVDADHDGFLAPTEIEALLTARFARLDTDGDRLVTRSEALAAQQRRGAEAGSEN